MEDGHWTEKFPSQLKAQSRHDLYAWTSRCDKEPAQMPMATHVALPDHILTVIVFSRLKTRPVSG